VSALNDPYYHTIKQDTETEIVIQKSRFLCHAKQAGSEEEARHFLMLLQKKYWDATHHCYAYRITDAVQKASDDGEPSGTAGRPILNVITKNELLYTLIVITRYFGGIKLGGGGLIRAYSQGAKEVISKAGSAKMSLHQQLYLTFDYTHLSKVEYELHHRRYATELHYGESITCTVWVPVEKVQAFQQQVESWTHGQVEIKMDETAYRPS
jgi:uncharacterized YigZ family protein